MARPGCGFGTSAPALLLAALLSAPAGTAQDADLPPWSLPHDRAALYDVFDGAKRTRIGDQLLLACELEAGPAIHGPPDLPWRYLFRALPPKRASWTIDEPAFATHDLALVAFVARGTFTRSAAESLRLGDVLRAIGARKDAPPVDVVRIQGKFDLFRGRRSDGTFQPDPVAPVAVLTLTAIRRISDGAVVGGRYHLQGTLAQWSPRVPEDLRTVAVDESREFVLREPPADLSPSAQADAIRRAVEQGARWLQGRAQSDGSISDAVWKSLEVGHGATALAASALLHSAVAPDEPVVRKAFGVLDGRLTRTYDLALRLMALEARRFPLETLEGGAAYSEAAVREKIAAGLPAEELRSAGQTARQLVECQTAEGSFPYWKDEKSPNISSLQYCLLGLKSASRLGVDVPAAVWKRAFAALSKAALPGGEPLSFEVGFADGRKETLAARPTAWPYWMTSRGPAWSSATTVTAALTSIALARSELVLKGEWAEADERLGSELSRGALAWLHRNYSLRACRPEGLGWGPAMTSYHLFSFERAMVACGIETLGGHPWHAEGAALLLRRQKPDGRWEGPQGTPVVDTAFALLFLKRAAVPVQGPPVATEDRKK
jgi:hypothetical protein